MKLITDTKDERLMHMERDNTRTIWTCTDDIGAAGEIRKELKSPEMALVIDSLRVAIAERDAAFLREAARRGGNYSAPIVCICGSTRYKQAWIAENARLTGEGNIVLAVGLWGHHERVFPNEVTKKKLDELHLRKIDLCDWV